MNLIFRIVYQTRCCSDELLVLLAVWNLLQAPSGHWTLSTRGQQSHGDDSGHDVLKMSDRGEEENLDPSGTVTIKNPGKKKLRTLSSAITQTVSCDHINNNKSSCFCLINMFQVNDSTVCVIVQQGSWLGNLREKGHLSCGFRRNVDHEVQLKAQSRVSKWMFELFCHTLGQHFQKRDNPISNRNQMVVTTCGALLPALVARCVTLLLCRLICVSGWVQTFPLQTF